MSALNKKIFLQCVSMPIAIVALLSSTLTHAITEQEADQAVKKVMQSTQYKKMENFINSSHDQIISQNIELQQIPAPPFGEAKKAQAFAKMMTDAGLDAKIDKEGNVLALWKGTQNSNGKVNLVAAHLDTVFKEGTDLSVRREGTKVYAPGILDDTRGLVALLTYVKAMKNANVKTKEDILFVGTVGEEGLGDLRGVKYLFNNSEYKNRIQSAIIVDGGEAERVVTEGPGSKRYEVHFKGPGGHSYKAFGLVNPMYAMGNAISEIGKIKVPKGTTYSVGVVGGGTSVNAIPNDAWMQIDMRSNSAQELKKLENQFLQIVKKSADDENATRRNDLGKIQLESKLVGDRPPGQVELNQKLVQVSLAATRALGWKAEISSSSTDANIPMSLNIPAVAIGGGIGANAHSAEKEYLETEKTASVNSLLRPLIAILNTAQLEH